MEEIHIDDDGNVNDNGDDDDDGEDDGEDDGDGNVDPNIAQYLQLWAKLKCEVKISSLAWPCCSVLQTAKLEWETLLCKRKEKRENREKWKE